MLDSFFSKGFKASKCKTLLKLTIPRINLLRNRRETQIKQMRREIAKLLETSQEGSARIRVENIIREEKMMTAQELVELFCELITARLPIIDAQKECPLDLKEAISSVCFAAPRCADLPELQQVQTQFASKYGKEFVSSATELMPECGVNQQLVDLLSVRAPSPDVKLKLLKEIAKEHELDWDPSASENELLKAHEDLLDGPMQFVSDPPVPLPNVRNDEAMSPTSESAADEHPDSDEDFDIIDFPEVPRQSLQSNKNTKDMNPMKKEDAAHKISTGQAEEEQFVPFIRRPPSQSSVPFPVKETGLSPSVTKTFNGDEHLQDVLAAAQAAAETAEGAAAAARSASSIAQLCITELMKKKNEDFSYSEDENPFHLSIAQLCITELMKKKNEDFSYSEDENPFHLDLDKTKSDLEEEVRLHAENPFAQFNTPFTSPGRSITSEPSIDDAKCSFDSFSYGSLNRTQTSSQMDDDTYFSYPNLFTPSFKAPSKQ